MRKLTHTHTRTPALFRAAFVLRCCTHMCSPSPCRTRTCTRTNNKECPSPPQRSHKKITHILHSLSHTHIICIIIYISYLLAVATASPASHSALPFCLKRPRRSSSSSTSSSRHMTTTAATTGCDRLHMFRWVPRAAPKYRKNTVAERANSTHL